MPTALRRHQYELLDQFEKPLLLFGTEDTGYLTTERPLFESAEVETADLPYGLRDGFSSGRDYLSGGGGHVFAGMVLTDRINKLGTLNPEAANEAAMEELRTAWRTLRVRDNPRAYAILRKVAADGTLWRTYGRPRDLDIVEGGMTAQGATPFTARFASYEEGWYSDLVQSVTRRLYVPTKVAIRAPIRSPITTIPEASDIAPFEVLGKRDTWVTATFYGPVVNPVASFTQDGNLVEIGLDGSVPGGQAVEVNSHPWARGVRRVSDGAARGGMISTRTPQLSRLRLAPGPKVLTYRGTDSTGTSYVRLSWRSHRNN